MCSLRKDGEITVHVDGPYGESEERPAWTKHPVLIIFAGGIGVRCLGNSHLHGLPAVSLTLSFHNYRHPILQAGPWPSVAKHTVPDQATVLLYTARGSMFPQVSYCDMQVTPVLGIIQDLNRRRKAAKEAPQGSGDDVPSHVHLIFSARADAELALLHSDIISEAR